MDIIDLTSDEVIDLRNNTSDEVIDLRNNTFDPLVEGISSLSLSESKTPQGESETPQDESETPQGDSETPQGETKNPTVEDLRIAARIAVRIADLQKKPLNKLYEGMRARNPDKILKIVEKIDITPTKLMLLQGLNWLNDELVNVTMGLLNSRDVRAAQEAGQKMSGGDLEGTPARRAWCTNSFFYTKLCKEGYPGVCGWPRRAKVAIFGGSPLLERMFIPINLANSHWVSVLVNLKARKLTYYDSLGGPGRDHMDKIWTEFLDPEHKAKMGEALDRSVWSFESPMDAVPQQSNCSDCGVFTVCFGTFLTDPYVGDSLGLPLGDITQDRMPYFRDRIGVDIMQERID